MRALVFGVALGWLCLAHAGTAFVWDADADSGAVADDNWLFNDDRIQSVGVSAGLEGRAKLVAPTYEVGVEGNVLRTHFESDKLPDAQEFGASVHAVNEYALGSHRVAIGYRVRDTLLGIQDTDGIAGANEEERTTWLAASSVRELGPRTSASIVVNGSRVRYASPAPDRNDYDFGSIRIGTDYELSPTLVGSMHILADGYQTEPVRLFAFGIPVGSEQQTAFSVGPGLSGVWEAGPRLQMTAQISARRRWNSSEVTFALPSLREFSTSSETDDPEYLGELSATRAFDRGLVRFGVHRNLVPSSLGRLRTRDTANFFASRELSDQASLSIAASVASEQEETALVSNRIVRLTNTRWVNVELSYAQQLAPNVAMSATYRYRAQNTEDVGTIEGNGVSVTLTYRMGNTG